MLLVPNILTLECEQCVNVCCLRETIQTCRNLRKFLLPQLFCSCFTCYFVLVEQHNKRYANRSQSNVLREKFCSFVGVLNKAYCMICVRVLTALQCTMVLYSRSSQEVNTIPLNVGRKRQPFHIHLLLYFYVIVWRVSHVNLKIKDR